MERPWRIELLGGLRARQGERVITHFRTRKTGILLAYLAYHQKRAHAREELMELLWPECDPELGRQSFRKALSSLRCQMQLPGTPPVFLVDRTFVQFNPAAGTTDVAELVRTLHSAARAGSDSERAQRLASAVELYRGELLPGHYEEWILQERRWLAECYCRTLGQLLARMEHEGHVPSLPPSLTPAEGENHLLTVLIREMSASLQRTVRLSPRETSLVSRLLSALVECLLGGMAC